MLQVSDHWLGSESSLAYLLDAMDQYRAHPELYPPRLMGRDEEDDDEEENPLIQIEGSIGILNINGPLTSRESWLDEYFGITSYPAIARGMIELTDRFQAGEIDQIIHVFSTPGGDANGINGLTEVMQGCLAVAPNTISYTGSQALSAGYWLATVNDKLYTYKMAEVGSIGVISAGFGFVDAISKLGVERRVYTSGESKSMLDPFKPESHRLLKKDPQLSAVRVRELLEPLGCTTGKAVVDDYLREVRPLFATPAREFELWFLFALFIRASLEAGGCRRPSVPRSPDEVAR